MQVKILSFEAPGLILRRRWGRERFTIAYGEILTAERVRHGIRLHTRTSAPIFVAAYRPSLRALLENELRRNAVRVVDRWGALLTPTLADFFEALDQEPERMRQLSDNA